MWNGVNRGMSLQKMIICNEEGRLLGLPHNCEVCGIDFVGTIVFAGVAGEDFADFPIGFQNFKKMFWGLWG